MKAVFINLFCCLLVSAASAQTDTSKIKHPDKNKVVHLAEAACGQCQLGLDGNGCDLAVRINGKAYYVAGTSIDAHGDAHAADGFCNAVRKAKVQGHVVNNRFKVSYFELLPDTATKEKTN